MFCRFGFCCVDHQTNKQKIGRKEGFRSYIDDIGRIDDFQTCELYNRMRER